MTPLQIFVGLSAVKAPSKDLCEALYMSHKASSKVEKVNVYGLKSPCSRTTKVGYFLVCFTKLKLAKKSPKGNSPYEEICPLLLLAKCWIYQGQQVGMVDYGCNHIL